MGLLCFVLDLPSLPSLLLVDIKRILLHVSNICAVTRFKHPRMVSSSGDTSVNIALCCVDKASTSDKYELRIIYKPTDPLNLRQFHHAVTSLLPSTSLTSHSGHGQVSSLGALLQLKDGMFSWAGQQSAKKIIMITSLFLEDVNSFRQMLVEAADRCVAIDFVQIFLEKLYMGVSGSVLQMESLPNLGDSVTEFENCTFQRIPWDLWKLASLEKKWVKELVNDVEGSVEIILIFHEKLYKDIDKLFCSLHPFLVQLEDSIQPCQTCRCHGAVMNSHVMQKMSTANSLCPVTGQELDTHDFTSNGVQVGSRTVLYLPSFMSPMEPIKLFKGPKPSLAFTVSKCILLSTLSEGLLFGDPYIVVPTSEVDLDYDTGKLEINDGVFSSLCDALHSQDCGLLCASSFDIDMGMEKSFPCYYLLFPSENRLFLARRIAASEELMQLSLPELKNQDIPEEMRESVRSALLKISVGCGKLQPSQSRSWPPQQSQLAHQRESAFPSNANSKATKQQRRTIDFTTKS
ncbi:hypothetical protein KP509_04G027200 [Ceratopteris richardii]|uniref:Uncharacterized protein n=1 Tax=Ceratopteris richardii TaxID=49495 RepID=A0A8T2URC1_CERRI|nr:hypothetical protein KP509_04G027200 [Ceratopteris richardii]